MRQLTSIVAVNRDGVIGCRNSLPWRIKSDMAFFKESTSNNCVIMGRRTYDSLGRCLPNRYNIVLSNQLSLFVDTSECVLRYGIADALTQAERSPQKFGEVFVIGGSTMYEQFDHLVDRYLITIVDKEVPDADAFFDLKVMKSADWEIVSQSARLKHEGDEAPYQIFELFSRDRESRVAQRKALVDDFVSKQSAKIKPARRAKQDVPKTLAFGW